MHGKVKKRKHVKSHGVLSFKEMVAVISASWKNADKEVINYVRTIAALIMKRRDDLKDAWKLPVSHSKAQDIVTLADETTVVSDETATANANVDYPSLTDVAEVSITLCQVITHDSLSSHLEKLRRQEQKKGNEGSRNLDELSFASMGDVSFASIGGTRRWSQRGRHDRRRDYCIVVECSLESRIRGNRIASDPLYLVDRC